MRPSANFMAVRFRRRKSLRSVSLSWPLVMLAIPFSRGYGCIAHKNLKLPVGRTERRACTFSSRFIPCPAGVSTEATVEEVRSIRDGTVRKMTG